MRVIADYKGSRSSSKNGKRSYGSQAAPSDLRPKSGTKVGLIPAIAKKLIIITLAPMSQ
ncbi:hypothetical protein ACVWZZ_005716 [Bradyrhizobium sp. LM6.10]